MVPLRLDTPRKRPTMHLDDYQSSAAETAIYPDSHDTSSIIGLSYTVMGLAGEAGEIANKVKKILRDNDGVITGTHQAQIASELGDVLWYVAMVAEQIAYPLDYIAQLNLNKLAGRAEAGTLQGSGDNR